MIALWIAVVGAMLLAISYAFTIPAHIRQDTDLGADQVAMQVYGYGSSINDYINATPGFTEGAAPAFCPTDAPKCITPKTGLKAEAPANWNGYMDKPNGQPRILLYSNTDIKPDVLTALSRHGGGSLYIGRRVKDDPQHPNYGLQNLYGQETATGNTYLPSAANIDDNAIVFVWRQ